MIINILPEGSSLKKLLELHGRKLYPAIKNAVAAAARLVQAQWITNVNNSGAKEGWKRRYVDAVTAREGDTDMEAFVEAKGMFVNFVENGIKSFDMKPGLLNSPKAKTSKKGIRYMIVPFQYGIPGTQHIKNMPPEVYSAIRSLSSGSSLGARVISALKEKGTKNPEFYQGLTKVGEEGHHQYFSFRVVSAKSKGWIYPIIAKVPIYDDTKKDIVNKVLPIVHEGLMKDLESEVGRIMK